MFKIFKRKPIIGTPKLNPCPFCGESPVIENGELYPSSIYKDAYVFPVKIRCKRCNIETKEAFTTFRINNGLLFLIEDGSYKVAKIWNTRAESGNKEG